MLMMIYLNTFISPSLSKKRRFMSIKKEWNGSFIGKIRIHNFFYIKWRVMC